MRVRISRWCPGGRGPWRWRLGVGAGEGGDGVAQPVDLHRVGVFFHLLAEAAGHRPLKAGEAGGLHKLPQDRSHLLFVKHVRTPFKSRVAGSAPIILNWRQFAIALFSFFNIPNCGAKISTNRPLALFFPETVKVAAFCSCNFVDLIGSKRVSPAFFTGV